MRLALTVLSPLLRQRVNVMVEAEGATEVGEIAAGLARLAGQPAADLTSAGSPAVGATGGQFPRRGRSGTALFVDGRLVSLGLALADSPIRHGCVVSLGDPSGCPAPEPGGIIEIRVASGPAAGRVYGLSFGQADIGSGPLAHITIDDPKLPDFALRLSVDAGGEVTVCPLHGTAVLLDRGPVSGPVIWPPGAQLAAGSSLLELARYAPPDAALQRSGDGAGADFNRPPRLLPPQRQTQFRMPAPPANPDRRPLPILMAVLPVALGVGMYFMLGRHLYVLAFVALSPVMMISQYFSDKRRGRKSHAQRMAGYRDHKARIEHDATAALEAERAQRRTGCRTRPPC